MQRKRWWVIVLIALALTVAGCDLIPGFGPPPTPTGEPPAAAMLPQLPGYKTVEGQLLTEYIGSLSGGAALLTGHPELAAMAKVIDQVIGCYQEVGAARARVYSDEEMPLSAGAVAIADRSALLDPKNFFRCVVPVVEDAGESGAMGPEIKPCSATYILEKDGNTFYILYAGTTEEICQTFCANLEGCTEHP